MPLKSETALRSVCDPSLPPADGYCLFFTLSQELRDNIYSYALSADRGLTARMHERSTIKFYRTTWDIATPQAEFNQLQYTNKQLRTETNGFLLKLNSLTFPATGKQRETELAETFLAQCGATTKAHLREIYIDHGNTGDFFSSEAIFHTLRDNGPLSQHCLQFPQSKILVRFPMVKYVWSPWTCIGILHVYQRLFRGKSRSLGLSSGFESFWEQFGNQMVTAGLDVAKHVPGNLRISRRETEQITQKSLADSQDRSFGTTEEAFDGLVTTLQELSKEGI